MGPTVGRPDRLRIPCQGGRRDRAPVKGQEPELRIEKKGRGQGKRILGTEERTLHDVQFLEQPGGGESGVEGKIQFLEERPQSPP